MIPIWKWVWSVYNPPSYVWIDVTLIAQTRNAVLVQYDDRQIWLPKVWIEDIKKPSHYNEGSATCAMKIKISEYHWMRLVD